ncbi:IMP dehydrogenase [Embleya sp. NBC_00896]|uniref:IMP dehydrogenase n=1 Tax=Embleya sp. NBC_00896 TaxID=2975961 RepID=UPI002F90ACD9|nr:IMP dehydrogenase [Embleya sp. NBC_00896]
MKILSEVSRTLGEYLLLPNLTTTDCTPDRVDLTTGLVRHAVGTRSPIEIATPLLSAVMEAVSSPRLAVALAQCGGLSFVHQNQAIDAQAADVAAVKRHKAGFRPGEIHVKPNTTLGEVARLARASGQDFVAVTEDGTAHGRLLGLIGLEDFHPDRHAGTDMVTTRMRRTEDLVTAPVGVSLSEANTVLWDARLDVLPVLTAEGRLESLVLRRDYDTHKRFRHESIDTHKRLRVAAGINTRDHADRVPALVDAGADLLCIDSSDGFSAYQAQTLDHIRSTYGDGVYVGAGNVVDGRGFDYLADAGAAFVKVGIGGGSICTTRAQKGIGRGQASAMIAVAEAREAYAQRTGVYVPLVCDGGVLEDSHMAVALAMGADAIMLGRYFVRTTESPTRRVRIGGQEFKEYWGEGSARARNVARYESDANVDAVAFEEGVDGYVPYAGSLYDTVAMTVAKVKATMVSCGSTSLPAFRDSATLVVVSEQSFRQTGAEVLVREQTHEIRT